MCDLKYYKMKVKYNRVSTILQTGNRFKADTDHYDMTLLDKVSCSVSFMDWTEAKKLFTNSGWEGVKNTSSWRSGKSVFVRTRGYIGLYQRKKVFGPVAKIRRIVSFQLQWAIEVFFAQKEFVLL